MFECSLVSIAQANLKYRVLIIKIYKILDITINDITSIKASNGFDDLTDKIHMWHPVILLKVEMIEFLVTKLVDVEICKS